jgi:hypothetical protein
VAFLRAAAGPPAGPQQVKDLTNDPANCKRMVQAHIDGLIFTRTSANAEIVDAKIANIREIEKTRGDCQARDAVTGTASSNQPSK